jgi:hypothetical protein
MGLFVVLGEALVELSKPSATICFVFYVSVRLTGQWSLPMMLA